MNQVSAFGQSNTFAAGRMAELCIDPRTRKRGEFWVEVPGKYSSENFPSLCQIDMWGEKTCSTLDDYPRVRNQSTSCKVAYAQGKQLFEQIRTVFSPT